MSIPLRIVVAAHKGGVGKTTVAVNLAGAFAEGGLRTLVVDVDPQGGATAALGCPPNKPTLHEVLTLGVPATKAIVSTTAARLEVLPADLDLAGAEISLPRVCGWQTRLCAVLAGLEPFDVMIFDSAPGLGILAFIALAAADNVLIPAAPSYLSVRSIAHVLESIAQARAFNARLRCLGIVPSAVPPRTCHRDEVLAELDRRWPGQILPGLERRVVLEDAAAAGEPITAHAPNSSSAASVRALSRAVLAVAQG
jgi:chromosome partitioning protein